MIRTILFLLSLFTLELACAQDNFTVHVGANAIKVPIPAGYAEAGAQHRKSFPTNSPNALLAWFVRTNDLSLFEPNATNFFRDHLQVQTLKQWTDKNMSDASFAKFVEITIKQRAEENSGIAADVTKLFEKKDTNEASKIEVAIPKSMETFLKTKNSHAAMMLAGYTVKTPSGPKRVPMAVGSAIVHIGNKCLFMYVYKTIGSRAVAKDTIEAVRTAMKPWVEDTLRANGETVE